MKKRTVRLGRLVAIMMTACNMMAACNIVAPDVSGIGF